MAFSIRYRIWRSNQGHQAELRQPLAQKFQENQEVRGTQFLLRAAVDALSTRIAILDENGTIIAVNQAWRQFAGENGYTGTKHGVGAPYMEFIQGSSDCGAFAAQPRIQDVLQGRQRDFYFVYPSLSGERWFQLNAVLLSEPPALRILVTHDEITELKRAREVERAVDARIAESREDERRKIARELHDSTVQRILAVNLNLMGLKSLLSNNGNKVRTLLDETIALSRECMQELRSISYLLRPPLPDGHDFMPALCSYIDGFCKRSGIRINLEVPSYAVRMPSRVENALFRVLQEALSNIHRHSHSVTATVMLSKNPESVVLEIQDKGRGMPPVADGVPNWSSGGGLAGIQERIHELGGHLEINAAHPGTLIRATIPLIEDEGDAPQKAAA